MNNTNILKVSATTNPNKLGGAIVKTLDEQEQVSIKSVGANATNQAVKGIIVARTYLSSSARDLDIVPGFEIQESNTENGEVTIIVFKLTLK